MRQTTSARRWLTRLGLALALGSLRPGGSQTSAPLALGQEALLQSELRSWVVYWNADESLRILEEQDSLLDEVAVFAYHFSDAGELIPATPRVPEMVQWAKARTTLRVLVTVVNDVAAASGARILKDAQCVHDVLASPEAMAAHLEQLLTIAATADGIELDYENLKQEDREGFSALVRELAMRLHARGQWLSVVVQPKTTDRPRNGAGALDWAAIARHADEVKLMAYYYHHPDSPPGPLAPLDWVAHLTDFALAHMPPEKLCVVLSLYGFDWSAGRPTLSLDAATALKLARSQRMVVQRDRASAAPYFRYKADGVRHTVWFEDALSLERKVRLLRQRGVRAIGVWHLGAGETVVTPALQAAAKRSAS